MAIVTIIDCIPLELNLYRVNVDLSTSRTCKPIIPSVDLNPTSTKQTHPFSKIGNKWPPGIKKNHIYTCVIIRNGLVGKHPVSIDTEKRLIVIVKLNELQSHKHDKSLQWRHNERDGVPNLRRLDCILNRLFRRRSKKTSNLRITVLCEGNSPATGDFPAQKPVTRKMFPSNDIIMSSDFTI